MPTKVLLDTDIGSDIDDAFALAYLLAQPECELLGVTTVSGQPELRAQLADALCRVAAKDIPIAAGAAEPLRGDQRQREVPQAEALARWPHGEHFPADSAVPLLREGIRSNPGEVVLLAVGPLTNVAQLFEADAEAPALLKALVMMGGDYAGDTTKPEWNLSCDPLAARRVFESGVPVLRAAGLDVTRRVRLERPRVRERCRGPLLAAVLDFARTWFERREAVTFHDPLAAAAIFDDGVCHFATGEVDVSVEGATAGLTRWRPTERGRHEVAREADVARFFVHYFGAFREP